MGEDRTWTLKARFDSWGSDRLIWASRHHAPSVLGERVTVVEESRLREAEAELREAREALRDVLDLGAIDVGMWRVDVGINCAPLVRARGVLENGAQQANEG